MEIVEQSGQDFALYLELLQQAASQSPAPGLRVPAAARVPEDETLWRDVTTAGPPPQLFAKLKIKKRVPRKWCPFY